MMQLLKSNLEEVLLDGQPSLQLSEVGVHEAKAAHSWASDPGVKPT